MSNKANLYLIILISLFFHILTSYFSNGFYSQDEYFQIISPVVHLLGIADNAHLQVWEFYENYQIRPWFQSYLFFFFIKFLILININNPFIWIFFIQFVSSILGLISVFFFYQTYKDKFFEDNLFSRLFIFLFCFFPFFHARTSSENLGTTFFILGFILFHKYALKYKVEKNFYKLILSGLFLGISFIFRFQFIILIAGIFFWLLINNFRKKTIISLLILSSILFLIFSFSLFVDYFGYGEFNITFLNYFNVNFFEGKLDHFGVDPWWYYFKELSITFFPPIGIFFLISLIFVTIFKFNHIIIFSTLFYFLVFIIIGHKELRFLFPILFFVPFIICNFIDYLKNNKFINTIKWFLIIPNIIYLFFLSFIPATEQVKLYKFIYQNNINNLYYLDDNPYILADLEPKIFTSFLPKIKKIETGNTINFNDEYYLVLRDYEQYLSILRTNKCKKELSIYPEIININPNWKKHKINWYLIKCNSD